MELMTALQPIAFLLFQVFLLADWALLHDVNFLKSVDFLRGGRGEVRLSHHIIQILLKASIHENMVKMFQLIIMREPDVSHIPDVSHTSHISQISHVSHIHVHPYNWLISPWLRDIAGFYVEKRIVKHRKYWRRSSLLLTGAIIGVVLIVILIGVRVEVRRLLDAIDFKLRWIFIFLFYFNGVRLAVCTNVSRLVFKMFFTVVAEVPLLLGLH